MKSLPLVACAALLSTSAVAAPPATWTVEKAASSIRFTSSFSGTGFSGAFTRWNADIRFDRANLAASKVTATIDTTSVLTGDADRDQALPTDTFLAATRFPRAVFVAQAFKALGGGRYEAIGALSLRGVTRPLTLPFTLAISGDQARMNASVDLDRLAFGVGRNEWRKTDVVPANVKVTIALRARRG